MQWANNISKKLHTKYPVIQSPMYGVTTPEMVAATLKADCFGTLSLGDLPYEKCIESIHQTKQLTTKNFGVNIFVNEIPPITTELRGNYQKVKKYLEEFSAENGIIVELPSIDSLKIIDYHEQIEAIIAEKVRVVSFTFGNIDKASIAKLKANNVLLIGTCTSVSEAIILEKSGIDILSVQGWEAGGHRGSFVNENLPKIGGMSLLSQIRNHVHIPLIYAGGLYNPQTLLAVKILGAEGFQVGSLLLGSQESALKDFEKERINSLDEKDIVLTNSFSGRYARGVHNKFIQTIDNSSYILPYPYQNKLTNALRQQAKLNKNSDFVSIWIGQSIHPFSSASTTEILKDLISQTEIYTNKRRLN